MLISKLAFVLAGAAGAVATGAVPAQATTETPALPAPGTAACEHAVERARDVADAAAALASDKVAVDHAVGDVSLHPDQPTLAALHLAEGRVAHDVVVTTHARGQAFHDVCAATAPERV